MVYALIKAGDSYQVLLSKSSGISLHDRNKNNLTFAVTAPSKKNVRLSRANIGFHKDLKGVLCFFMIYDDYPVHICHSTDRKICHSTDYM